MTNPAATTAEPVAGIDVGKLWLDACADPAELSRRFENTQVGRRALRNWLRKLGVRRVALEPTGRYHRQLHQCLHDDGVAVVVANPLRARNFARALGQQAKNDRVDAAMLARYARLEHVTSTPPKPRSLQELSDWLALRRKLSEQRDALRKQAGELGGQAAALLGSLLAAFTDKLQQTDKALQACLEADPALCRRRAIILSVPGCDPLNAASLCADLPELGSASPAEAAALAGLAPRPPPDPRRPPPSSQTAVHGRHFRDPLQSRPQSLLRAAGRTGQAAQGRTGGGHAQAARPARGPAPRRPPVVAGSTRQRSGRLSEVEQG